VTQQIIALARHRLDRARVTYTDGKQLLESGTAEGAINRFYYAAFHAARALLAFREVDSSKHAGVIALFQVHFVKTGTIPPAIAKALSRSFEKRQKSDYGDFAVVTGAEAEAVGREVEVLIDACASAVEQLVHGD
jgi:uncharacterized protein (UPF0332 family)